MVEQWVVVVTAMAAAASGPASWEGCLALWQAAGFITTCSAADGAIAAGTDPRLASAEIPVAPLRKAVTRMAAAETLAAVTTPVAAAILVATMAAAVVEISAGATLAAAAISVAGAVILVAAAGAISKKKKAAL